MWFFYAVMIFLAGLAMFIMTEEIWKNYKEEKKIRQFSQEIEESDEI